MLEEPTVSPRPHQPGRERRALKVVEPSEAAGFVIPHPHRNALVRGGGGTDYACGACGLLLAIGVRPGTFRSFLFACACGALNEV